MLCPTRSFVLHGWFLILEHSSCLLFPLANTTCPSYLKYFSEVSWSDHQTRLKFIPICFLNSVLTCYHNLHLFLVPVVMQTKSYLRAETTFTSFTLYPLNLASHLHLTWHRCSANICWMNTWMNAFKMYVVYLVFIFTFKKNILPISLAG